MQVNTSGIVSLAKNSAIGPYLRVIMTAGNLALAGATDREIGVTRERVLASGLGAGTVAAVVTPAAPGTHKMIAAGAITQFAKVYGAAGGKVSATKNGNLIGLALQATTADGDELEVLRVNFVDDVLYSQVAASAAITNTNAETDFDKSFTIPANTFQAGDILDVEGWAIATATNSTDTLNIKLYLGATVIAASGALDVANSDACYFRARIKIRTIGAAGTLVASGVITIGAPGTATVKHFVLGSTAIDTTAAQIVKASATWSVANAGNSCRLDDLTVRRVAA